MAEPKGYLCIVLHAHLPYVRHPEGKGALEEMWLYEAMTETYIPLYMMLKRLADAEVPHRITVSLSPTLVSMFRDQLLMDRYRQHLDGLTELADREVQRTASLDDMNAVAHMYRDMFREVRDVFTGELGGDITKGFASLASRGTVELITCAATHGYLPLMQVCPEAARAQVLVAAAEHRRVFGSPPKGMWLPECGYYPHVDEFLAEAGARYFFVESHGVLNACPAPMRGLYAPITCPSGVAAFARDVESSQQVWSADHGYPGDPVYREFYWDIGFELDEDYLSPVLGKLPARAHTGFKYHRITGKTNHKEIYCPSAARDRALVHAGNFVFNRGRQIEHLAGFMDRRPMVVAPYDAELFGHWWFEGIVFLEHVLRLAAEPGSGFATVTASDYLGQYPVSQEAVPSMSSWGYGGYSEVWLSQENDWIYRHLHSMASRMSELARRFPPPQPPLVARALAQAARELMLAQSSDWAFIMKAGTCVDYAVQRTASHVLRFDSLYQALVRGEISEGLVRKLEEADNLFPQLDYTVYSGVLNPEALSATADRITPA